MRLRHLFGLLVLLTLLPSLAHVAIAQEWTRFRGPNGTGLSDCETIPVQWTEADYCWKVKLPGMSHGSPVVWGDKVFLLSADPDSADRMVLCYDARDGKQLWMRQYTSSAHHLHTRSSYASSTPAVDGDYVYVAWGEPEQVTLKAFDHAGGEVWSRELGPWVGQHGFGTSPMLFENMVILHNSQQAEQLDPGQKPGHSVMMAFDRQTGKDVWRTPLTTVRVCYSVPFILEQSEGTPELICTSTAHGVFSLNPRTGTMNWEIDVFKMRVVNSPVAAGGIIFSSNGSGGYSGNYVVAVRPGDPPELAYTFKSSGKIKAPYVTCPLSKGELLFLIHDQGYAACVDIPTGNVRWFGRTEGAAFNGSPIRVRDKIYCIDEKGVVWVIAADPDELRVLAKNPLGEESRSTPAVSGGKMFLRTYSHLICVGGEQSVAAGS